MNVEVGALAGHSTGVALHLVGGATADSGWESDFVRCCTDATASAGCVVYTSTYPADTAATATTAAAATCRASFGMNLGMGLILVVMLCLMFFMDVDVV